ncbi:pyridoxamine 5'-phosphate oxidase family protein [Pseudonocardia humida]|uniref:Pyridoxamine 5'-phosphate oxidase family protein n=1 Tax=Pseudonocardia humida TaxID=2800819 RepID=A0ABT1A4R1_9PSEU|nr:pyridoxamine 5'-phosphate oxidase family protein [Pseudonocardia humida]MCO1657982.1 pyridoxamine 5'-phosphate oxidase family protein [Pseudonocardia humida]
MSTAGQYHAGELAAQASAGLAGPAQASRRAIRGEIPDRAAAFLAARPMLVVGAADAPGRMWATLLTGPPGFVRALDDRTVEVAARPAPGDPLAVALARPARVGTLAIEPATRRRMRLNGRAEPTGSGLRIAVDQVYGNCPKYIARRAPLPRPAAGPGATDPGVEVATELSVEDRRLVADADTFFVATRSADGDADASHRGGAPGFLRVLGPSRLRWPDYSGNAMLMTLGNLGQVAAAGLLVPDWGTGTALHLTGTATVEWDPEAAAAEFPGAQRVVEFRLAEVVRAHGVLPTAWTVAEPSRFTPPAAR